MARLITALAPADASFRVVCLTGEGPVGSELRAAGVEVVALDLDKVLGVVRGPAQGACPSCVAGGPTCCRRGCTTPTSSERCRVGSPRCPWCGTSARPFPTSSTRSPARNGWCVPVPDCRRGCPRGSSAVRRRSAPRTWTSATTTTACSSSRTAPTPIDFDLILAGPRPGRARSHRRHGPRRTRRTVCASEGSCFVRGGGSEGRGPAPRGALRASSERAPNLRTNSSWACLRPQGFPIRPCCSVPERTSPASRPPSTSPCPRPRSGRDTRMRSPRHLSSGVPCVATDVGHSAALVGDAGRVVAPREPAATCCGAARAPRASRGVTARARGRGPSTDRRGRVAASRSGSLPASVAGGRVVCGLAGVLDPTLSTGAEELTAVVETMAQTLIHRGPDDRGSWVDASAGIALGFQRLSIQDLSLAGHQPMVSASGRYVMVFNGEIYDQRLHRAALEVERGALPRHLGHRGAPRVLRGSGRRSHPSRRHRACSPLRFGTAPSGR